jgi:hypothetical protein
MVRIASLAFARPQLDERAIAGFPGMMSRRHFSEPRGRLSWSNNVGKTQITHVPMPAGLRRVETGAIQFGEDWPGLFIRGNNAIALKLSIRHLEEQVSGAANGIDRFALARLGRIADLIEQEVIVRHSSASEG